MGKTYRHEKEWGSSRSRKPKKGKRQQPLTKKKSNDHEDSIYFDDLEVEAYERDLKNRKRYTKN